MRLALSCFSALGVIGLFAAACTVTTTTNDNPNTGTGVDAGGVTTNPSDDGGTSTDGGTCTKTPPTATMTLAAAAPAGSTNDYGQETALALDKSGNPLIAFSTSGNAGQVFFTGWDACTGAFKTPTVVDTVGISADPVDEVNENTPLRQVQIASDASTGAIAIAYVKEIPDASNPSSTIWIAKSTDNGATWTKEQLSVHPSDEAGDIHDAYNPRLTFASGKIWLAYGQSYVWCDGSMKDPGGQQRCDGWVLNGDSGSWTRQVFKRASNGAVEQIALETDSAGNPGIAFVSSPDSGYNRVVAFWRPNGTAGPVDVMTSNNEQNDDPAVSLAFFGTKPRIAAQIVQDTSDTYNAIYSQSDDGTTWSAVVKVPQDATRGTTWYQSLVADSTGKLSLLAYDNGGTDATPTCGDPQVMRSTDGTTWTPFCVEQTMTDGIEGGKFISARIGADNKLQLVFFNNADANTTPGAGVAYWHE